MNAFQKINLLIICNLFFTGCSTTMSFKETIFRNMAIGLAAGYLVGQNKNQNKEAFSYMYAAGGAATGAIAAVIMNDPDQKITKLTDENFKFKKDLESFLNPKTIYQTPATFNSKIPDKYKKLIEPGEWRISEIDKWIEDSENRIIHQDKVMELIPPSLKPN